LRLKAQAARLLEIEFFKKPKKLNISILKHQLNFISKIIIACFLHIFVRNILQQLRQIHLGMPYLKSYSEAIPRQDVSNLKQKEKPYDKMQWNNSPCKAYRRALTGCRGFFTL